MRFWSGTQVGYGNDHFGPSVVITGNPEQSMAIPANNWKLDLEKQDSTRIWRPVTADKLERIQVPCPDSYAGNLKQVLSQTKPVTIHPAIINGLETEALRLFPRIDQSVIQLFTSYINYLRNHFQLDEETMKAASTEVYTDGFGPELMVQLNDKIVVLPEIPPVWLAPTNWIQATWRVTNGMTGPYADETMNMEERLGFIGDFSKMDIQAEGLVYYQAARAMTAWAAWENDPNARFVKAIVSIIMSGYRPLNH